MSYNDDSRIQSRLEELLKNEKNITCGPDAEREYLAQHTNRFKSTLEICKGLFHDPSASILDIGRSPFTELLLTYYSNVFTLGFDLNADDGGHREDILLNTKGHIIFNLDDSKDTTKWPQSLEKFDLITFCETIEHLHTAPEYTIAFLSTLLKPNGKLLITTPNAATLKNRIKLLFGTNPFEQIRLYDKNPGHFREYTLTEMVDVGKSLNLKPENCRRINFYHSRILGQFKILPAFKDSLVIIFSKN